jgi:hypothetical protein
LCDCRIRATAAKPALALSPAKPGEPDEPDKDDEADESALASSLRDIGT